MAGGKQTPRQRMIGILYLVLLGLIALNVPDSLLDAFKHIADSLDISTQNVTSGVQSTYSTFEKTTLVQQHDRALPIYNRAKKASAIANTLNDYVKALREQLVTEGGGINESTGDVAQRDNLDISPRIMITDKKGEELRQKINDTRIQLLATMKDDKERAGVNFSLNAEDPPTMGGNIHKSWQEAYFGDGIPLGATITTLAKIQTDTKNAENEVVKKILSEAEQAQVNLDKFDAVAVAPTSYVLVGQPYTAEVFLTAYDSHLSPNITVGGSPLTVDAGKGKYSGSTSAPGSHTWTATISFKDNDGKPQSYTTPLQTYMVAAPSAVVKPDKMNVLYIGVPNPVSVSAPGVATRNLHVSMTNGSISGSEGNYTVNVTTMGTATITVTGEIATGKPASFLGSSPFRVKRIPDPKAQFAGKSGGNTSAANIRAQEKVFAKLDNFDFDAKFNVTRFTLMIAKPRQDVIIIPGTGSELTPAMRTAINTVAPGTTVEFKDIIAVGPDGTQRGLDPIVLNAN
jgi:gliding motility-associated protein GldM